MLIKHCSVCSCEFSRNTSYSNVQWASQRYCSKQCSEEKKRRTRAAKHRCKDCGGDGPFRRYTTTSGRVSRHSRCDACRCAARRIARKKQSTMNSERRYSQRHRQRMKIEAPHRITHSKAWAERNPLRYLYFRMQCNARKNRGRTARIITYGEFVAEVGGEMPKTCPVFGLTLTFNAPPKSDCIPTVDRLDSSRPYERGNIAIISWRANIIKNMGTADEHRRIADWIEARSGGK